MLVLAFLQSWMKVGECGKIFFPYFLILVSIICNLIKMKIYQCSSFPQYQWKLEQLERLRSEDTPRRLMITHTIESCWIPSHNKVELPWRYRSRSKIITCDTPSHANDHLYQIWKESIQNCRRYRADTILKVKGELYRSRTKVITCDTPSDANDDLCQIWKECKQNCRLIFMVKAAK